MASRGALTVVGTGIKVVSQTTAEAVAHIERAQKVYFLAVDALTQHWLLQINSSAESLHGHYDIGKNRSVTYEEIVERVMDSVRAGLDVCFVVYGHPGVFAFPPHEAVRRARAEGFPAAMYASVSAEDCLFADLGVDPAESGCQSFEATDFLVRGRIFDPRSTLILWQIGAIGEPGVRSGTMAWNRDGLGVLAGVLMEHYGPEHEVTVYEAAAYGFCDPLIERVPLAQLADARVTAISTLYVPPRGHAAANPGMLSRLGLRSAVIDVPIT